MDIVESTGLDLSKYINSNCMIRLTANRCNNLLVDNKVFINDARVIHFFKYGSIEIIIGDKGTEERHRQHITVRNVESVVVESVYW